MDFRLQTVMNRYISILILAICSTQMFGQIVQENTDIEETDNIVIIKNADNAVITALDTIQIDSLLGDVQLFHDSTFMFCDTAIMYNQKDVLAFGNVAIVQNDSLTVYCDTLYYYADSKEAELIDRVVLDNNGQQLKTDHLLYDLEQKIATFDQGAVMKNETSIVRSKKGTYDVNRELAKFYLDVQVIDTSFTLLTDTMFYFLDTEKAKFFGPTKVLQEGAEIYAEQGFYQMKDKQALFEQNAQYKKDSTTATANQIFYDGISKEIVLEGNATYIKGETSADAIKIVYNEETEVTTLTGDAIYRKGETEVISDVIVYNGRNESVDTKGRTFIEDASMYLESDEFSFSDDNQFGLASGDVIWIDTTNDTKILCDSMLYNDETDFVKAFNEIGTKPLFINYAQEDTMWITADTLVSYETVDSLLDTIRYFQGFEDVKILQKGLSALCDSMAYSSKDSLFQLFKSPIVWVDTMQLIADSMDIKMKNNEIDQVKLRQNSLIVSQSYPSVYDQIKGRDITVLFEEKEIHTMLVEGNAESIYFMKDEEEAYIGADKTACSKIRFYFEEKEISKIEFLSKPESTFFPIQQVNLNELVLSGFRWEFARKPVKLKDITLYEL